VNKKPHTQSGSDTTRHSPARLRTAAGESILAPATLTLPHASPVSPMSFKAPCSVLLSHRGVMWWSPSSPNICCVGVGWSPQGKEAPPEGEGKREGGRPWCLPFEGQLKDSLKASAEGRRTTDVPGFPGLHAASWFHGLMHAFHISAPPSPALPASIAKLPSTSHRLLLRSDVCWPGSRRLKSEPSQFHVCGRPDSLL
jgi:hypothetical protein